MSKEGLDDLNAFCCDADEHNNSESGGGSGASEETINREPAQAPATTDDAMRNTREDIQQHYGLADNCYGNRVIDNIMKRSTIALLLYQMGRAALAVACCVWCELRRGPSGPVKKGFCLIFFTIYPSIKLLCNACCLPVPGVRLL